MLGRLSVARRIAGGRALSSTDLVAAGRRIRRHLDTEMVIRAAVDEVHRAVHPLATTIWLIGADGGPRRAYSRAATGRGISDLRTPDAVMRATRRGRKVHYREGDQHHLAVPIIAPKSGLVGVLLVEAEAMDNEHESGLALLVEEVGLALETANLYERAVLGKEKSEAILSHVADAIVVTDFRGSIQEWNRAAEIIFGVPAGRVIMGDCASVIGLMKGEHQLDCRSGCPLLKTRFADDGLLGSEVWRSGADGRRQPLLATVSAVTDADGNVSDVIHSLRDITRLKEADEAKNLFLATASHELKSPLTVIQGFAKLLATNSLPTASDRGTALDAIIRRAAQLNDIVDRVLLSSRIEAGGADVVLTPLEITPILRERTEAFASSTGREIVSEIPSDLHSVLGDPNAVATILDHLLENAVKYSPGGGRLFVRAAQQEQTVTLAVTDTGIGMVPDQLARCFDKFWQAESSDVRRFGGTGIGLYIVRSLAAAMGGTVQAESEPGKGTTFTVTLKRSDASAPIVEEQAMTLGMGTMSPGMGEPSMVREFMRQIGIPTERLK